MAGIDELAAELRRRVADAEAEDRRCLLGLTGVPGSGKSTVAARLAEAIHAGSPSRSADSSDVAPSSEASAVPGSDAASAAGPVRVLPMDGFHLTNTELEARGIRHRKGAPPSFDAERFVALLERLRNAPAETVFAPLYSRKRHEPIADALTIGPEVRLVIVEGNYLLLDDPPWDRVAPLLTETWFLDVPVETALERVRARHRRGGCGEREAERKIATNDRPNAELVLAPRGRADRIIKEPG